MNFQLCHFCDIKIGHLQDNEYSCKESLQILKLFSAQQSLNYWEIKIVIQFQSLGRAEMAQGWLSQVQARLGPVPFPSLV